MSPSLAERLAAALDALRIARAALEPSATLLMRANAMSRVDAVLADERALDGE